MLQAVPALTANQIRGILHSTATQDANTGVTPNDDWGAGKLNVLGALNALAALIPAIPAASPANLAFGTVTVGTVSPAQTVTLSNTGTAALPVTSVAASAGFLVKSNGCGASLAAGAQCLVTVAFQPSGTGPATGTLTIKDVNASSPQKVALTGTGG